MFRSVFIITLFTSSVFAASAQTRQPVSLEHATVFLNGAELFATAKLQLPAGESYILFTNVAGSVNPQSLSIGADNRVVVQSANFQNDFLTEEATAPIVKMLEDSLLRVAERQAEVAEMMTVLENQINVLRENKQVPTHGKNGGVADVEKMVDIVGNRMPPLLARQRKLREEGDKLAKLYAKVNQQLQEEKGKTYQAGGQLLVKFYTDKPTTTNVRMTYVTPNASWQPTYDIRVDEVNKPVRLVYKANVRQNSGINWKNVRLTLSTGNPSEGAEAPQLQPWNIALYVPQPRNLNEVAATSAGVYRAPAASLSGARFEATPYVVDGIQMKEANLSTNNVAASTLSDHVQVNNGGVTTSFDIDLPYTVNTDGREQLVSIKTVELPATYRYYAAPKVDNDAFLQARVTNWEGLNLMSAPTNIFYEGSFVGNGYLDLNAVQDTINLSLGRDKKVLIRRELDEKMRAVKTIGTNIRESRQYSITVKNTRKEAINLTLVDQYPLSNDQGIVIEDKQAKEGIEDEEKGLVTWNLKLDPAATKEVKIGYTVKYPKGKTLIGFR